MKKTVKAIKDKVAVKIIEEDKSTPAGIIIPASVSNEPQGYGIVISIGEDVKSINPKDIVIFNKRAGQDIILNAELIKIMFDSEIYGIIKTEE